MEKITFQENNILETFFSMVIDSINIRYLSSIDLTLISIFIGILGLIIPVLIHYHKVEWLFLWTLLPWWFLKFIYACFLKILRFLKYIKLKVFFYFKGIFRNIMYFHRFDKMILNNKRKIKSQNNEINILKMEVSVLYYEISVLEEQVNNLAIAILYPNTPRSLHAKKLLNEYRDMLKEKKDAPKE